MEMEMDAMGRRRNDVEKEKTETDMATFGSGREDREATAVKIPKGKVRCDSLKVQFHFLRTKQIMISCIHISGSDSVIEPLDITEIICSRPMIVFCQHILNRNYSWFS